MIGDLLTESIVWKQTLSVDEHDQPTTSTSTISARVERVNRVVALGDGTEKPVDTLVFTTAAVEVGDQLTIDGRDRVIEALEVLKGIDGAESHREALL